MFPNLRLIIGAALATTALVMIMGSGLFSFRDPYHKLDDVPDIGRPLVQHAIAEYPEGQQVRMQARRSGELQRLLDLPVSPVRAYASEPPAAFPFVLTPPAGNAAQAMQEAAATITGDTTAADANPANARPDQAIAALPSPPEPAMAEQPAAAPPVPQQLAPASADGPAAAPPPDGTTAMADETAAARDDTASVPASAVPAVELAPLPRANPRVANAGDDSAERPVVRHSLRHRIRHARSRRIVQIVRTLPGWDRRPAPAEPAAQIPPRAQEPLPTTYEKEVFGRTGIGPH